MRTIIRYLAIVYVGYVAVSVLIILPAVNFITPQLVQESLGRELRSEIMLFNPFTLTAEIRKASLLEPDGEVFVSTDRALVNLSMASLWHKGLVFDEVAVGALYVHVKRLSDGNFNFSDMLSESPAEGEVQPSGTLPGLTVHQLNLQSEQIRVTDEARAETFTTHWDGLSVQVQGISTVAEEGRPYSLSAVAESGGRLHWAGKVSIPRAFSEGTLQLENLSLHPVWRYAQEWLAFDLKDGSLSLSGDYRLDWGEVLDYQITNGVVSLSHLDLQASGSSSVRDSSVAVAAIEVQGIDIDGVGERVEVASFSVDAVDVQGFSDGSEASLVTLFEINLPKSEPDEVSAPSNWAVHLPVVQLTNSRIRWRSEFTSPPVLDISPIRLGVTDLSWPPTGKSAVNLSLSVNGVTTVAVDGDIGLDSGDGELRYKLDGLQLAMFNPTLPAELNAKIGSGAVAAHGEVLLKKFAVEQINIEGSSTDFSAVIQDVDEALTSWDSVRWQGLHIDLEQRNIALQALRLNGYSGRLHIYEDGTINAQRVLQEKVEEAMEEGTLKKEELRAWTFDIPSIFFTDSELDFTDESLPIKFQTVIGELNGDISGLSSSPEGETRVDLKGSVDGYAPVVLAGTARPFAKDMVVDMGLSFDGVDLVRLSPYSGTYAGYAIDRGLLTLDLHYFMEGSRLKGENSLVISQLKLGEKIDSDKAVDLPLGLALALLTDSNGVIDMDVPVSGDVDDPEFGLGSVIVTAFVNLISKAVTAPFTLLANLVGSEEDMQRLSFSSGSSELDETAKAKLTDLVQALDQRPGLSLVLHGRLHLSADLEQLQKAALREKMLASGLSEEAVSSKSAVWTKAIEAYYEVLEPKVTSTEGESTPSMLQQYQRVLNSMQVGDEQLESLAEERAVSLKRFLVNELQFPPDRSAIEAVDVADEAHVFSGVELDVDN